MMIAVAGSNLNVNESRNATAPTGPKPGNTPTRVPTSEPRKQNNRLFGVSATEKPSATLERISTLNSQRSDRQRNSEQPSEDGVRHHRRRQGDGNDLRPALRLDRAQQQNHQNERGQQETQSFERESETGHGHKCRADSHPALFGDPIGRANCFYVEKALRQ